MNLPSTCGNFYKQMGRRTQPYTIYKLFENRHWTITVELSSSKICGTKDLQINYLGIDLYQQAFDRHGSCLPAWENPSKNRMSSARDNSVLRMNYRDSIVLESSRRHKDLNRANVKIY